MKSTRISRQIKEFVERLVCAIRAGLGLIWLYTTEEVRAKRLILSAAKSCGRNVRIWSCASGMHDTNGKPFDRTVSALDALNFVLRDDGSYAYVFLDLPAHMTIHADTRGVVVLRRLKDVAIRLLTSPSVVFVVTTNPTPPKELSDLAYVIELPLPDAETLKTEVLQEMAKRGLLDLDAEGMDLFAEALLGATLQQAEDILAREVSKNSKVTISCLPAVRKARAELVGGVPGLQIIRSEEDLPAIGGMPGFKQWLNEIRNAFTQGGGLAGLKCPRGVLFVGPPGVGKSLLAKTIARMLGLTLLRLDIGAVFSKYIGESEANLRRVASVLDTFSGAVVWVDEIEKGLSASSTERDGGTSARVLGDLLTWGQERKGKVFFVATANDVEALRPETFRIGRFFSAVFFIDLPVPEERNQIFRIHLRMVKKDPAHFDLDLLVAKSDGYTGAEIEAAIQSSLFIAYAANEELGTKHVLKALRRIKPMAEMMTEEIERIRDWGRKYGLSAGEGEEDTQYDSAV